MSDFPPREDDWILDPELAAMNRRLQREIREESEEVESIVAESELRARTLRDVLQEARNRGDHATVATSTRTFSGRIVQVGKDFISVDTEAFDVDITLDDAAFVKLLPSRHRGGQGLPEGPGTFEMRLVERKDESPKVEIGYRTVSDTLIGNIVAVAQDHLLVRDEHRAEWVLPTASISYVLKRARPHR